MPTQVDWNAYIYLPRKHGADKRIERYYKVTCHQCCQVYWLRRYDANQALEQGRPCMCCKNSESGKLGYQVALKSLGSREALLEKMAETYRETPSNLEQRVLDWLATNPLPEGVTWKFQAVRGKYIIDFVFFVGERELLFLEINGYWHQKRGYDRDLALIYESQVPVLFVLDSELEAESFGAFQDNLLQRLGYLLVCPF